MYPARSSHVHDFRTPDKRQRVNAGRQPSAAGRANCPASASDLLDGDAARVEGDQAGEALGAFGGYLVGPGGIGDDAAAGDDVVVAGLAEAGGGGDAVGTLEEGHAEILARE